jgi:cold shock CspA family protein
VSKNRSVPALASNPLAAGLIGVAAGFLVCWIFMVRPLMVHLDAREQALHEWERINRQEREAIATVKSIGVEELRKWVSTLDEQNTRYAEIQTLLHKQELELVGPPTTHLVIALAGVISVFVFVGWMMRDSNADAARTLHNAVAVLPALRESIEHQLAFQSIVSPSVESLPDSPPKVPASIAHQTLSGRIKKLVRPTYGYIAPDIGGPDVFFHKNDLKPAGISSISEGQPVIYCLGADSEGRTCAKDIEFA